MTQWLYLTSSSYSGSTLLSFLLNTHQKITTLGEAEGWNYGPDETFHCSCGAALSGCTMFLTLADAFRRQGLPFEPRQFGTRYRLVTNDRLNRYLTADLPFGITPALEPVRDRLMAHVPSFAARLSRYDRANVLLSQTALLASNASVFLDTSKSVYRLRHLRRIAELDIRVLHLVRDPRGVVCSNMKKKHYPAALAVRLWLSEQITIARIAGEQPNVITVYYEDLCSATDETLAAIHSFVGLAPQRPPADYQSVPHHILGNEMRLARVGPIVNDVRWTRELSAKDLEAITSACAAFRSGNPEHPVSQMIARYASDVVAPPPTQQSQSAAPPVPERTMV